MNKNSGFYKNGKSHAEGGIPVLVDGSSPIEVEKFEYFLCNNAMNSTKIFEFKDKTNKEILDEIFRYSDCEFEQHKANSGDFIICKLAVMDKKKRNITGTAKEIINVMQSEKSCNVTNDSKEFLFGGEIEKDKDLELAKRMYKRGESESNILEKTGWFLNPFDNLWRYEIDDSKMSLKVDFDKIKNYLKSGLNLGLVNIDKIISHDELFFKYPFIKKVKVKFIYDKNQNVIRLVAYPTLKEIIIEHNLYEEKELNYIRRINIELGTIYRIGEETNARISMYCHELTHVFQIRYGMASGYGSNRENIYSNNEGKTENERIEENKNISKKALNYAGEIEAKEVEKRLFLTHKERRRNLPFENYIINNDIIIELEDNTDFQNFKQGGEIKNDETYTKWKNLVNMSKSELENFYESKEGKEAGLSSSEASKQGISSGRESARWIMKMKNTPKSEWTPTMWKWANKQISFISRMSGMKGNLYDDKGNKTRKHTSLLIWGHNPEKYKDGGFLEKRNLTYIGEVGGHNLDIDKNSGFINVYDGKKRYELSDNDIALLLDFDDAKNHCLNNKNTVFTTTIGKVIKHDLLFKAYPEIKDIKFSFYYNENKKQFATYYKENNTILYNFYGEKNHLRGMDYARRTRLQVDSELRAKVLLHEIQHFIQVVEILAKGSSIERELRELFRFSNRLPRHGGIPDDFRNLYLGEATRRYNMSAGELEANDTMNRINLTDEERKQIKPFGLDKDDDVIVKLKDGGELNANEECAKYIKENENVFKNGYYSFVKNMSIYADSYNGKIPKIDSFIIISYNSGGQNNLKVTDTINSSILQKKIGELIEEENGIPKIIISKHLLNAKRVNEDIFNLIKNNNVVIIDRDEVVCSNLTNNKILKNGGELKTNEMENKEMEKPIFDFMKSNPMQQARALTVLEKRINVDGEIQPFYKWIENMDKGLEISTDKIYSSKSEKGYVERPTIGDNIVHSKAEQEYYKYLQTGGEKYSVFLNKKKKYDDLIKAEQDAKRQEADKIREEENKIREEKFKKAKNEEIKELIEKGFDFVLNKRLSWYYNRINELKGQRKSTSRDNDIAFEERMILQKTEQLKYLYKIATELYKIENGEVVKKYDWKVGDKVLYNGKIQTTVLEVREPFILSKDVTYKVEKKDGIYNQYISYDGLFPIESDSETETLQGGKADKLTIEDIAKKHNVSVEYAKEQLNKGMKTESEHTKDTEKQKEIALDHLSEFIDYYKELDKMEEKLKNTKMEINTNIVTNWDEVPKVWRNIEKVKKLNFVNSPYNKDLIKLITPFTGDDNLRPIMSGIHFDENGITATDAHKLINLPYPNKDFNGTYATVPKKFLKDDKSIKNDLFSGNYPNYKAVIPTSDKAERVQEISVYKLLQYTEVALHYASQSSKQVAFSLGDIRYGLNGEFLIDVLKTALKLGHEKLYAFTTTDNRAIVFSDNKNYELGKDLIILQMPLILLNSYLNKDIKKETHLGAEDFDWGRDIFVYYDFSKDAIVNQDGSIAEFKMNYGEYDVLPPNEISVLKNFQGKNNVLPILDYFKVQGNKVLASNLETFITIKNTNLKDGLYQIRDNAVEFDPTYTLSSYEEYPKPQDRSEKKLEFSINSDVLLHYVKIALEYNSGDELRPVMTGILFDYNQGKMYIVSTDAHKLLKINITEFIEIDKDQKDFQFILSENNLLKFLDNVDDSKITISSTKELAIFENDEFIFESKLIDGKYPAYNQVISAFKNKKLTINIKDLFNCIKSKEAEIFIKSNKGEDILIYDKLKSESELSINLCFIEDKKIEKSVEICKVDYKLENGDYQTKDNLVLLMPIFGNNEGEHFMFNYKFFKTVLETLNCEDVELFYDEKNRAYIFGGDCFGYESTIKAKKKEVTKKSVIDVENETANVINEIFNEWEKIKNESQHEKWSNKVNSLRFGTYKNQNILDVIEKFSPKYPNEVIKKDFIKELYKSLKIELPENLKFKTEIKEQSNEQKEFLEAINTFEELIKLGGTDAEIKEWQEAIDTFKMLLDDEPTKYAKGGELHEYKMKQGGKINFKPITIPL